LTVDVHVKYTLVYQIKVACIMYVTMFYVIAYDLYIIRSEAGSTRLLRQGEGPRGVLNQRGVR